MSKILRLSIAFSLLLAPSAFCQSNTSSPYSKFGLGEINTKEFVTNKALGGTGITQNEKGFINLINPASYASLQYTVFEGGLSTSWSKYETTSLSQLNSNTNLSYFAIGFPIGKKWGTSISLLPFSSTSFTVKSSSTEDSIGNILSTFKGSGGINQIVIGNAYSINKNWQFGLNISYLFGTIHKERTVEFTSFSNGFNTRISNDVVYRGLNFDYGLIYKRELKNNRFFNFGLIASIGSFVNGTNTETIERFRYRDAGGLVVPIDSVPSSADQKERIKLPASYGVGVGYGNKKWKLNADYKMQNWTDFNAFGDKDYYTNSNQLSAGIQLVPNIDAINSYFNLVHYRAGIKLATSNLEVNNTALQQKSVMLGAGFPIKKSTTFLNLAVEAGQFGTTDNSLIKESFIKVHFSITFNDRWFIKRQID